jgi:hypothetical protein
MSAGELLAASPNRFERTTRPARYRFRLKVVRQAGLPFQSGVSPVVAVSVRP